MKIIQLGPQVVSARKRLATLEDSSVNERITRVVFAENGSPLETEVKRIVDRTPTESPGSSKKPKNCPGKMPLDAASSAWTCTPFSSSAARIVEVGFNSGEASLGLLVPRHCYCLCYCRSSNLQNYCFECRLFRFHCPKELESESEVVEAAEQNSGHLNGDNSDVAF